MKTAYYAALTVALMMFHSIGSANMFQLKVKDPTWCMVMNSQDQCVTILADKYVCDNSPPCKLTVSKEIQRVPVLREPLHYCYGVVNDVTGECGLFLGTEKACQSVERC